MCKNNNAKTNNKRSEPTYVAFDPAKGKKPIACGSNVGTVICDARQKGVEVPAVLFVPQKGMSYIY